MIKLSSQEKEILSNDKNDLKRKMLESIIHFGDFYDAKELVNITGNGHVVLGFGNNGFEVAMNILDEIINKGFKTKYPFTVSTWPYVFSSSKEKWFGLFWRKTSAVKKQAFLEKRLEEIGLNIENHFMDAISLGKKNSLTYGDVLCWSDSMLVTFANSVFGAKVNCAGPLIDLFCNILGKVPYYGLLTPEGRMAQVIIKVDVNTLPDAGLLGVAVAHKSAERIPYIYGLEKLLKAKYDEKTLAFLKDFAAGFSSEGNLKIFHINGITPEAKKLKKNLIAAFSSVESIDMLEIEKVKENLEIPWKNLDAKPNYCFLGQPDLSLYQLVNWTNEIGWELKQNKRKRLKIKTIFLTNNHVLEQFKKLPECSELKSYGGVIKTISPFNNLLTKSKIKTKIITNSNQIRQSANVKFCKEEDILSIITGKRRKGNDWI